MISLALRRVSPTTQRLAAALIAGTMLGPVAAATPPRAEATITRTEFGVPHIEAKDFRGLGFGIAYAEAEDNICLMADTYLSVSAQRSKYLGAEAMTRVGLVPANNLDSDVYYATMLDAKALRAEFRRRSSDYRNLVSGWVAGYNRFLVDNRERLPADCAGQAWVRPITSDDVIRSLNSFSMLSGTAAAAAKITSAAPPSVDTAQSASASAIPASAPLALPEDARLGSNGWAFGGDATSNGRGLVVGNPHFPWFGPNRFYQMHLTIPGKLDVAGAGIINQPFVGIGFNKDVAWTHTVDTAAHMRENGAFPASTDLHATLDLYFQCCSITVNAPQMGLIAATLANGGVCPTTNERIFNSDSVKNCLSLMASCGMYDFSGEYSFTVGLPAKSGVSGALFITIPGLCGIAIWSPRLDALGNSVRGVEFSKRLTDEFAFHTFSDLVADSRKNNPRRSSTESSVDEAMHLCAASSKGDINELRRLVARNVDINLADYDGRTALHLAASDGRADAVHFLLERGANADVVDRWGNRPLDDAERGGHAEIIAALQPATPARRRAAKAA